MNWTALFTAISSVAQAVVAAIRPKPAAHAEPPAPTPPPPGFAAIDRAEQERLARESAASVPPVVSPRPPMDALVDSEAAPTVRKPE